MFQQKKYWKGSFFYVFSPHGFWNTPPPPQMWIVFFTLPIREGSFQGQPWGGRGVCQNTNLLNRFCLWQKLII